jgi:hypothetical protein
MSLSVRDIALVAVAVLVFPVAINLTSLASSDGVPDRTTPIFQRGGGEQLPAAVDAAADE